MRYRIRYLFLLLAIPFQLAAVEYTVSITTNTCGNVQTYTIPEGEQMVLYAHPMAGYTFAQWSDGNTENPRILTMTSDASYAAEFVAMSPMPTTYDVTVYADGCTPKVIPVAEGEQILLNAHAKSGYAFSQWSDGNTDNPRIVTIDSDVTFTAEFVAIPMSTTYDVTVYADGCTPKVIPVAEGEQILLNAHAKSGYVFSQWSDGNTDNPRAAIINADATFVAQFKESDEPAPEGQYTITVKTEGCSTELTQNVSAGAEVKLYAHPKECNYFFSWSDGNTDNPRTITVNSDATYTAIFKAEQYTIYVESADETLGTVSIEINQ